MSDGMLHDRLDRPALGLPFGPRSGLGPFDYENEVYTANLWVSEGFTDYYGDLIVRRAGLSSDEEYLNELSNLIRGLQTTPGRLVQSASEASHDAWIRQYRPDENSPNVSISYYTKGAVVAFLLDTKIRQATAGWKSLDDVMRLAYARFAGPRGFTTAEFRSAASEVAGTDLGSWFAEVVDQRDRRAPRRTPAARGDAGLKTRRPVARRDRSGRDAGTGGAAESVAGGRDSTVALGAGDGPPPEQG